MAVDCFHVHMVKYHFGDKRQKDEGWNVAVGGGTA